MSRPRTKPYTKAGIRRVPCVRCDRRGHAQWQICADGNRYRVLCLSCDVALNELVMCWAFGKPIAQRKISAYIAKHGQQKELPCLS